MPGRSRLPDELRNAAIVPVAVLAFNLGYGAALSMLEDQASSLFIGAAAGQLWQVRWRARAYGANRIAVHVSASSRPSRQAMRQPTDEA